MTNDLEREPGDLAEWFDFDPEEEFDWEKFDREANAARWRREQQRPPEGAASQDEIYKVAIAFLVVLIIIIVMAIWFSVTSL